MSFVYYVHVLVFDVNLRELKTCGVEETNKMGISSFDHGINQGGTHLWINSKAKVNKEDAVKRKKWVETRYL